jgi:hypothetical protein
MAWEPDYVTVADFKVWARITDADDDVALARTLTAASRAVDRFCGQHVFRQFGQVAAAEARYYTPRWDTDLMRWVIEIDDLADITGLVVEVDTSNSDTYNEVITAYVPRPRDAIGRKRVYTQIAISTSSAVQPTFFPDSAKLTSNLWGWSAVPTTVTEAVMLQTNRIHKRRVAPFKDTGSAKRGTRLTYNLIERLDPDIETMLESYVKIGWTI